jgi:RNA polymerase sigma-70 factor (ECF subfamily)
MTAPTQQPQPDSALIERIVDGDENALSTLYDRYSGMLFAMLVRILKDTHAAEEVLQDLFLQLWRNGAQFDASRGSVAAWLLVIGRNRAISRLRSRSYRESAASAEGFSVDAIPSPGNLEDQASRMQLAERVRAAMAALSPEQRETVEMAYFEGMTQSEIAARTGSPLGTVKTRARTALQNLKQYFGG